MTKCIRTDCPYYNVDNLDGCSDWKGIKGCADYLTNANYGEEYYCPPCPMNNCDDWDPDKRTNCHNFNYLTNCKKYINWRANLVSSATMPEPPPSGDGDIVLSRVLEDLQARGEVGKSKYDTYLRTNNGRDALNDAYQEVLDLAMYLKQRLMEEEDDI